MSTITVACVEPQMASNIWPRVRSMIDTGYAAGDNFMPEDILEKVRYGQILLWIAIDEESGHIHAAMTTELVSMRCGLVCWMGQCSGDRMQDWSKFHGLIEEYAKDEGCVKVILQGRRGWEAKLDGFKIRTVQLEKML